MITVKRNTGSIRFLLDPKGGGPAAAGRNCPLIFMTAMGDDATRNEEMETGCIAYWKKPFAPQLLLDVIAKAA